MDVLSTWKYEEVSYNCNALSKSDKNTILYVSGSTAIPSCLCCILALVAVILIKQLYKKATYRLAIYMVIASLCDSFAFIFRFMLIDYDGEKIYYFGITLAHAASQSLRGLFVGLALIFHVILTFKKSSIKRVGMKSVATYAGVTPYTSGAITTFPLPKETDVDDRVSLS